MHYQALEMKDDENSRLDRLGTASRERIMPKTLPAGKV
jgi:hypothetical protein